MQSTRHRLRASVDLSHRYADREQGQASRVGGGGMSWAWNKKRFGGRHAPDRWCGDSLGVRMPEADETPLSKDEVRFASRRGLL